MLSVMGIQSPGANEGLAQMKINRHVFLDVAVAGRLAFAALPWPSG